MRHADIYDQAKGRWRGILLNAGIPERYLNGKHQDCPLCKEGKDRFRFTNKNGNGGYYCNQCGPGSGVSLLMEWHGLDFKQTVQLVREHLGDCKMDKVKVVDIEKNRERIKKIHTGLKKITHADVVGSYLKNRGLDLDGIFGNLGDIYYHPGIPYWDSGVNKGDFPAMVGVIRDAEGKTVTLEINYLTKEGKKAEFEPNKKIMPPAGDYRGCGIILGKITPETELIGVAEGITSGLAWMIENGYPVLCALSAENMKVINIPKHVKQVFIIMDNDDSYTGQVAAFTLAKRLKTLENKLVNVTQVIRSYDERIYIEYADAPAGMDYLDYVNWKKKEGR